MNPKEEKEFIDKAIREFKDELEETLDEYFPKVEEEGAKKRAMKRGEALALFSMAIVGLRKQLPAAISFGKKAGKEEYIKFITDPKNYEHKALTPKE